MKKTDIKLTEKERGVQIFRDLGKGELEPEDALQGLEEIVRDNMTYHSLAYNSINAVQIGKAIVCQLYPNAAYTDSMLERNPNITKALAPTSENAIKEGVGFFAKGLIAIEPEGQVFDGAKKLHEHLVMLVLF